MKRLNQKNCARELIWDFASISDNLTGLLGHTRLTEERCLFPTREKLSPSCTPQSSNAFTGCNEARFGYIVKNVCNFTIDYSINCNVKLQLEYCRVKLQ